MKNITDLRRAFAAAETLSNFDFGIMQAGYDETGRTLIDAEGELVCVCADEFTAIALVKIIDAAYDVADGPNMDEIRKEAERGRSETP